MHQRAARVGMRQLPIDHLTAAGKFAPWSSELREAASVAGAAAGEAELAPHPARAGVPVIS